MINCNNVNVYSQKYEFFTQYFYLSLEGMDHFMEIQPQKKRE